MGRVGSSFRTAGGAVSDASVTRCRGTASGATTGAKAVAKGATTGARATSKGAKAIAGGAAAGGKAVASGATRGAKAATGWLPGGKGGDLADRVEAKLKKDSGVNTEQGEVRTEGKNVYLIFSGGTRAEWNRAVVVARKVDGVDNVFIRLPK